MFHSLDSNAHHLLALLHGKAVQMLFFLSLQGSLVTIIIVLNNQLTAPEFLNSEECIYTFYSYFPNYHIPFLKIGRL